MEYSSIEAAEKEARILAQRMTVKHNIYKPGMLL
ncbi:hypothetical protein FB472_2284 [Rhodoglobus vestalii]|uniref:Uncharacterized protein n=1 Tax=Rhodoglobus vestalii TaxID=193384 RepID=A0A8H2K875_9MICO|nr:hypothetical protein FB472_2284 [Rhodoglobus vestalii]